MYRQALLHVKSLPNYLTRNLPPYLQNPEETSIPSLVYWLRSYDALLSTVPTELSHTGSIWEWLRENLAQKKGRQTYFSPDGSLQLLHI